MNQSCETFREQIVRGLVDDLDGAERRALEEHLAACPDCLRERGEMRDAIDALRLLRDERPPRHFFVQPRHDRSFRALPLVWKTTLAAAILLVIVAAGLLIAQVHVRAENGVVMVSLGQPPEERWIEPLRESIVRAAVDSAREEDREMAMRVGDEIFKLREDVEGALILVRDEIERRRLEDLGAVRDSFDLAAAYDRRQDERTEAIVAAVNAMGRWDRP